MSTGALVLLIFGVAGAIGLLIIAAFRGSAKLDQALAELPDYEPGTPVDYWPADVEAHVAQAVGLANPAPSPARLRAVK